MVVGGGGGGDIELDTSKPTIKNIWNRFNFFFSLRIILVSEGRHAWVRSSLSVFWVWVRSSRHAWVRSRQHSQMPPNPNRNPYLLPPSLFAMVTYFLLLAIILLQSFVLKRLRCEHVKTRIGTIMSCAANLAILSWSWSFCAANLAILSWSWSWSFYLCLFLSLASVFCLCLLFLTLSLSLHEGEEEVAMMRAIPHGKKSNTTRLSWSRLRVRVRVRNRNKIRGV